MLWKIWFDIRNLRRIIFHKCAIHFFTAPRLLWENLTRKRSILSAFLNGFWAFSRQPLEICWQTLVRSQTKWTRRRSILSTIEVIFRVKDDQNRPKFMNDPIFFGKWNLFDKVSNCSRYHFKSENWGPSKCCSLIEIF